MKKATSWQVRKLILTPAFADKQPIIAMNAVLIRTYQPSAPVPSALFRVADGSFTRLQLFTLQTAPWRLCSQERVIGKTDWEVGTVLSKDFDAYPLERLP